MATTKNIEFWREFINLYCDLPAVWKIKSDDYKNRDLKSECYVELTDKLKELQPTADMNCTKRKINTLRSNFRRELKNQINSRKSGAYADDMYEPTVWYFNDLEFLRDQVSVSVAKATIITMQASSIFQENLVVQLQ
ncbi:MADF domain [Cinara cedri]|uniref:MADF domain n=1 Tax=Cinara cedri TaxID=506608 RepID=A0A5E4MR60_9HEMI|nr:MADF domain [Cinara cedri]